LANTMKASGTDMSDVDTFLQEYEIQTRVQDRLNNFHFWKVVQPELRFG